MTESLGQRLRRARESRQLTLRQATESTRIRIHLLEALEADNYTAMTSAAQARGFLKIYTEFLGVDLEDALRTLQATAEAEPAGTLTGPFEHAAAPAPLPASDEASTVALRPRPRPTWLSALTGRREAATPAEAAPADEAPEKKEPSPGADGQDEPNVGGGPARPAMAGQDADADPVSEPDSDTEAEETASPVSSRISASIGALAGWLRFALRRRTLPSQELKEDSQVAEALQPAPAAPSPLPQQPSLSPDEILSEIGGELRQRREVLGLNFEEIEKYIHIRVPLLKALEGGTLDGLPSTVQTRGMLAVYAGFLDVDTDRILLRFADALQARHRAKYPDRAHATVARTAQPALPPLRAFIAPDLLFGAAMIVVLVALGIWGAGRVLTPSREEVALRSTAPSISEVLAGTDAPGSGIGLAGTPTAAGVLSSATPLTNILAAPTFAGDANIRLMVVALERTFLRVTVDGEEVFNGRVQPGGSFPFDGEEQVEILTGNGAALRVTFNGRDLGLMGGFGEVVSIIFTPGGVATPTPTVPPTATPTPRVTATPSPTTTPSLTPIVVSQAQ